MPTNEKDGDALKPGKEKQDKEFVYRCFESKGKLWYAASRELCRSSKQIKFTEIFRIIVEVFIGISVFQERCLGAV